MKFITMCILLCMISYSFAASPVDYNISGKVTNTDGDPLKDAKVLLKGVDVSVTTEADGKFELISPTAILMNSPQTQALSFALRGNALAFSRTAGKLSGNVTVLTGNGRCISSTDFSGLNPATEQITLPQLASGINIIRLTINNNVYTCQTIRLGNELHLINQTGALQSDKHFSLAKMQSSKVVDTLIITKEEFEETKIALSSYTVKDLEIKMGSASKESDIPWGKAENPTAGLAEVSDFPGANSLKADNKLPDPFMMLDGKRITKKNEWAARREELRQQVLHYIYGDKPIPPKEAVTGSVSTSSISVQVKDGGKSCSIKMSVDMNGGKQPAPAIITYGGFAGASAPSGVAKITFNCVETTGGSGGKKGAFFDFYGSNHGAGYMAAQAWEVSRVIDVLEQHPDVIDPYKIAVTGCSRWGKGAFAAGVLDNRVALTIPCESGIGGAVALRLVEQLGGGEWPYHAISYVRWLSEVSLRPFTSGNNGGADNTNKLPVDMHSAEMLIAPRALYIIDNPGINNLCPKEAWVTAGAAKAVFKALGVGDNLAYVGAGGGHCQWRGQYDNELDAMIKKFLLGDESAKTGSMTGGNGPDPKKYYDWDDSELEGDLW